MPMEHHFGLRYGRLSDPESPRSPIVPAGGQLAVTDLTQVPVFPQLPSRLERVMGPGIADNPRDPDAFYLNIWAPADARDLPVLVFVHGGAWVSGGGAARWYRGEVLAQENMVVVTLNYRIGPAGHLQDGDSHGTHRPIEDLLCALRWIREHISGFGGDPARVTLAGQSAGAWYAWALAGWDRARDLFQRVMLLSIPAITPWSVEHRKEFTQSVEALAKHCDPLTAGMKVLGQTAFAPGAIPAMYLPVWPRKGAQAPLHVEALYTRVTAHEMSVFLPPLSPSEAGDRLEHLRRQPASGIGVAHPGPPAWDALWSETVARASRLQFGAFAEAIADAFAARDLPVMRRTFTALSLLDNIGAAHCFDLPFQFGNRADWHDAPMLDGWSGAAFEALSQTLRRDLADFVHARPQPANLELATPDHIDPAQRPPS